MSQDLFHLFSRIETMKVPFLKSKIVNLQADSIQYQLHAVLCMRREVVPVQQCNTAGSPCKKGGGGERYAEC